MAKAKNTSIPDPTEHNPVIEGFDHSGFSEEENVGFAPYWGPDEAALEQGITQGFVAVPVMFDGSDPEFERYTFQAEHPITCRKGPKDEAEIVEVQKGELFSISAYGQIRKQLAMYVGLPIMLYVKEKIKIANDPITHKPRSMWTWGVRVTKDVKLMIANRRQQQIDKMLAGGNAKARTLPAPDANS